MNKKSFKNKYITKFRIFEKRCLTILIRLDRALLRGKNFAIKLHLPTRCSTLENLKRISLIWLVENGDGKQYIEVNRSALKDIKIE